MKILESCSPAGILSLRPLSLWIRSSFVPGTESEELISSQPKKLEEDSDLSASAVRALPLEVERRILEKLLLPLFFPGT
jgi:hypothetical protein